MLSPFWALLPLAVALMSVSLLQRYLSTPGGSRYVSIDGLRGYLAFFVVVHHAVVWNSYLKDGVWKLPESNLYAHFGQTSVSVFFMITGFLFWNKISKEDFLKFDWIRLYSSRVLRLCPLYYFAMAVLFATVFALSGWQLNVSWPNFMSQLLPWLAFAYPSAPDVNNIAHTTLIMAGAVWTLKFEWAFYLSLPFFSLMLKNKWLQRTEWKQVFFLLFLLVMLSPSMGPENSFFGGVIASYVVRIKGVTEKVKNSLLYSGIALAALALAIIFFPTARNTTAQILLTVFFSIIAAGNDLFGVLSKRLSVAFGEISYGVYLLHGFFLYFGIHFIFGESYLASASPTVFWLCMTALVPFLIIFSSITFLMIEKPMMNRVGSLSDKVKSYFNFKLAHK